MSALTSTVGNSFIPPRSSAGSPHGEPRHREIPDLRVEPRGRTVGRQGHRSPTVLSVAPAHTARAVSISIRSKAYL